MTEAAQRPVPPMAAGVILAAGAGSRFGGDKLLARIDGAALLAHVVGAARAAGLAPIVVVLDAATAEHAAALGIAAGEIIVNPDPQRGLASSVQLGLAAVASLDPGPPAAVVLLGDQPLVRPETITALVGEVLRAPTGKDVAVARYAGAGSPNPVALRPSAFGLAALAEGDRGLGPVLEAHGDRLIHVSFEGANPEVDTPADLVAAAEAAWADRVTRNRLQVERFRELPDGKDFYASVSSIFRDDPDRTGDPVLDALRTHARPDDTWLDIGAGAGRYALPLARSVREVIALDPSAGMLATLREAMAEHAIDNVRVVEGRWPASGGSALRADVSLIAHVGYDVEAIGPFIEAMERATARECLAVLMERSPAMLAEGFWPPLHGEPRVPLPALPAFVDYLAALGRAPDVAIAGSSRRHWASREEVEAYVRRQTWVAPGSDKDRRMHQLLDERLVPAPDGGVELSVVEPLRVGVVAWRPPARAGRDGRG